MPTAEEQSYLYVLIDFFIFKGYLLSIFEQYLVPGVGILTDKIVSISKELMEQNCTAVMLLLK